MKTALMTLPIALLTTVFSLGSAGQAPPSPATPPIGYISAQRIIAEATSAKADNARFQALQQQRATELRTKQQTLEATRQQLAQATDTSTRGQLEQQDRQQQTDLERATAQAQAELQALQRQFQTDLQAKVKSAVDDLAKSQNIQLVLNADTSVVWAAPGMDLTAAVVQRLNAASPTPKP
jgi:Skp family chaperone for outer membrane proteins